MVSLFRIFKRVISRLLGRKGSIGKRVEDLPSSFLVKTAATNEEERNTFFKRLKLPEDDKPDAEASLSSLEEYVNEITEKGRNRAKIKRKGAVARKKKRAIRR